MIDRYFPGDEAGESGVVVPDDEVKELETVASDVPVVDDGITEKVEPVNILIFDATNYVHIGATCKTPREGVRQVGT